MENKEPKHVYIVGNKHIGFHGHTHDKEIAKAIEKSRDNFEVIKIKNDQYCKDNLSVNTEFMALYDEVLMTAEEEEYFIESFSTFQVDIVYRMKELIKYLDFFKFNDDERNQAIYFIKFLLRCIECIENEERYEEYEDGEIFDNEKAMKWFITNVLDK